MQGKILSEQSAMAPGYLIIERHVHVGIDVCMEWLDVYLHPIGQAFRVGNTPEGLRTLKRKLAGLDVKRIVMEATAKFHRLAHRVLHAAGYTVAIVNPLRSRLFAEAAGQLAKTDRIDARMLAIMGESLDPAAMAPTPESLEALQELLHARDAAITEQTAISNRCGASELTFLKAEFGRRLKQIATHIERLNDEIERRIKADPALERRYNLLLTIPCVGPVAALTLVIALPELGTCSGKAASLLAGLAPVACESGQKIGERHIKGGRAIVRKGLYFAAVAAMRYNPQLAELYKRLRKAGKKPKVALTALMRKLVVLANTILTEDRPWSPIQP